MELKLYNPHWERDFFYKIDFKRNYYSEFIKKLDNKFIINLLWLRRVWKTTLLKQFIDYLILEKQVNRKNIFFYSFDSFWEVEEKIEEYKKLFELDFFKEKVYIFFDEIQKIPDWQSKVKIYFDIYPNIKFILTWSSSLYLQKKESLAWRMFEYRIKPIYFDEYLRFKKLDYYLEEKAVYKDKILIEFEKYIFRQFIDIIDFPLEEAKKYMEELKNKVIKEDIVFYFKVEYPNILISIFKIISSYPWMLLDYKNFANDLNIDQRTLERYIYFLSEANLITKIYNFSKNIINPERKLKKVYLNSCSFFSWNEIIWELFENYIQNTYDYKYFWRLWDKEVDFVDYSDSNIEAIEVKYKSKIKKEDLRGVLHFQKKFNPRKSLIITKDYESNVSWIEIKPFYM